jgi:hypothetical protein
MKWNGTQGIMQQQQKMMVSSVRHPVAGNVPNPRSTITGYPAVVNQHILRLQIAV